jgi:hypothetical protein
LRRCVPGTESCLADKDCKSWELCNPSTKKCEAKRNLCSSLADCESWQICDVDTSRCVSRIGYCSSDTECNTYYQKCNAEGHKCETRAGYCTKPSECAFDEFCQIDPQSVNAYRCVKILCSSNDDCPGSTCDPSTQRCRKQL